MREMGLNDVTAFYINQDKNQVVFKIKELPNMYFKTNSAISVARTIVAIQREKPLPIYEIPSDEISDYVDKSDLPDAKFKVDVKSTIRCSEKLSPVETPSAGGKVKPQVGDNEEVKHESEISTVSKIAVDTEELKHAESTKSTASEDRTSEAELGGADIELTKDKSKCLLTKATLDNFTLLKVIGEGAFGRVFLAKKDNGKVYAMKRIRKDKVLRSDAVENILLERKILSQLNHPLLLSLKHVFASEYRFYFFCDYIIGSDLMKHLKKMPSGFTISQIKFISAQLVLAFECLHDNSIAHRDLKPENVLIDQEGYIRLADFGLAKDLNEGEGKGSCGTLEYMAPEIVNSSSGHNFEVDWWCLGILMYEMYYGKTPFLANTRKEILDNILKQEPEFPDKDGEADTKNFKNFKSIISKLLRKDPTKRLGHSSKNQGAKKVKKHSFFKSINWAKILDKSYEAPYIPNINIEKISDYLKRKG